MTTDLDAYGAGVVRSRPNNFAALKRRRVLVVGPTEEGRDRLAQSLGSQAFQLDTAGSLEAALKSVGEFYYDAALLCPLVPGRDGLELVRSLNCPVIVVATPTTDAEIVDIVNSGAADFVTDRVSDGELAVRVWKVIFNPPAREPQKIYNFGGFRFDCDRRICISGGRQVGLTPHEAEFLEGVIEGHKHFATYAELIRRIWGDRAVETQNLRVLAAQVRKKIERDSDHPELLITVFGRGYRFMG